MLPHMQKIDPEKLLFDLIAFDGAANVQNAGALMEQAHYLALIWEGHGCQTNSRDVLVCQVGY